MRRKSNKLISILLVFCMVLSILPINVFASDSQSMYVVAGVWELCGNNWDPSPETSPDNIMTANGDGTFSKVYIDVAPMDNYQFKVVENTSDGSQNWYGIDGGADNFTFNVEEECNVTVTFNPTTKAIAVTTEPATTVPVEPVLVDYYLFGVINGADYGEGADYENMGDYKFVNNELTVTFTETSYVGVKTTDNGAWYMTDGWLGETTEATLFNTSVLGETVNKLMVPTGEVKFTLTVNDNDTLKLSYTVLSESTAPVSTVSVTTVPETTLSATTGALTGLNVTATSNYFPEKSVFIQAGEEYVTVTYYIDSTKDMLNCQWELKYDPKILSFEDAVNMNAAGDNLNLMPIVGRELYWNVIKSGTDEQTGVIRAHATNLYPFKYAEKGKTPFVTATFKIVGSGETTVDLFVDILTLTKTDPTDLTTNPQEEEIIIDNGSILDTQTTPVRYTDIYAGEYVPETTIEYPTAALSTEESTHNEDLEGLLVNTTSNYFPEKSVFIQAGQEYVTVTYCIDSAKDMLNCQWQLKYDPEILKFENAVNMNAAGDNLNLMPVVGREISWNVLKNESGEQTGVINADATNLYLYRYAEKGMTPFITATFKIMDSGETTVDLFMDVLTLSKLGSNLMTDPAEEEVVVDRGVIKDTPTNPNRVTVPHAGLYDPLATNPVETEYETTEETAEETTEPVTTIPVTTVPVTTVPVTTVPVTTAPPTTAPAENAIYVVAGSGELCGTLWNPSPETDNVMTANGDGTFSKVYTDVAPMDRYQFKIVENLSDRSVWYGIDGGDDNFIFNVEEECDVTVTFDLATKTITVTGDGVEIPTGIDIESMRVSGNGDGNWLNGVPWDPSANENLMTEVLPKVYEITYTDIDEFDNYQFKFVANGSWYANWGGVYAGSGVETDAVFNSSDSITFEVPYELADVTLRLDLTNFDYETKLGAKFTITVTEKTEPVSTVPATTESETIVTETTFPATTGALTGLNVTATSNYFPEKSVFIQAGEEYVTVTYYIDSAKDMLNCQWELKYDPEILSFEDAVNMKADGNTQNLMPLVEKQSDKDLGLVWNVLKNESGEQTGVIKANATSLELYDFADKGIVPFVTVTFRVIGSGETTVDLFLDILTLSKLGSNLMTDPAEEESVVNYGVINDTPTKPVRNTSVYAGLFGSEELCEHNNTFEYPEVPESCTEDGYTAGVFCEDCQNWISGHKLIKRHHNYGEWETVKEPTCTEDGLKVRNCSVCGTGTVNLPTESLPKCTGSDYKYNMDKTFSTFTVPDASQIIIHFSSDSYLESNFDYLYIYEGDTVDSDHLVNKYSGSLSSLAVTVNASSFTLRMVTDGSVTKYGFEIESLEFSSCEMGSIPALGHDYGEWETVKEPTCTEEGEEERICTRCNNIETDTISVLGHDYGEWEIIKEPTCTDEGEKERVCTRCNNTEIEAIPVISHDYGEWETVKEPTCTEDGLKVRNCSVCGTGSVNLPEESLPKCIGSDYTDNMDKTFSTFTVPDASKIIIHFSTDSYLESNYDYLYVYEGDTVGSAHLVDKYTGSLSSLAVTVNASSFTLRMVTDGSVTKYGFEIESLEFSSCEMGIIPALGHDYSEEWTIDREPTCTTEGIKSHHCTRCDSQEDITEVSMLPHTYTLTVVPPTCTEDGYTEHTCSVCGYSFNDTVVPELGHNIEEYVQIKAPTCTDTGTAKGECTRCSYSETRTIDALGHSYSDEWTVDREPTCTTDGSKSHHCTQCDNKDSITVIQALGHDYETQVVDPNCTEKGYTIYTCSRCGDTYRDDYVDAAGHKYVEWQTRNEPTCTEKGVKYRACSVCSNEETGEIPAKGHSYGDWIVDKEATVLAEGSRHRVCTDCNHSETQTIDRVTIDINTNTDYGLANFTVVNAQTLEPIKNACIFISTEKDGENTFSTDSSGKVSFILPVGKQAVSVYAEGCLTRNTNVTVKSGVNDIPKIGLSDKSTYTAEVTHHLMSMDEIKDAGIDTSAVDNQHIFKYELKLEFQPEIDWLSLFYYMGDSGEILGGGGTGVVPDSSSSSTTQALNGIVWIPASTDSKSDGGHFYIPPTKSEPATCVYPVSEHFYLIVRGEVRWLKEMFDVEMLIVNNSQTDTLENLTATLNIPEGLSLATMVGEQQTAAQQIEKIDEGESKSVHWYLRGDTAGDYNITARLQGMIMPFEEPIDDVFESREALHVWAGNALNLHFEFPDSAYYGEDYPITITLENVSDVTLYNLSHAVQIEQGMEIFYSDGTSKQKIERSKWETVGVDEFRPGDKIIIQTSVNIFFESEVIERKLEQWVGFVDDIEQLMNAFKMLKTAYDATESLINCVSGCSKALDSFILSSGGSSDKLELFKQLHSKISGLALSYSTSGNKTLDAAVKLANSGVSASLNAITNDPDEWLKNHSVNDIKKLIKNVESLENSITDNAGSSSRFDIYDSIRTAISAIPTKFALKSVTMTENENNTTSIPWSYSVSSAGAHYFGVSNVSKYLASIAQAAMSEIYDEAMPDYIQLIPGLDDPFNKDDAVSYIKATENEIAKFKAKAATGDVTFRAWVESSNTMKSILPVGTLLQALPNELANSGFVISCDNETAQYQGGVLTFTGDGTISVIPENLYGGTLYIQDSEGHLYTYVLDVVPEHVCHKGDTEIVIPPTEEYDGFAVKRCETCYDVLEIIPLSNEQLCSEHTFGEWNVEKEASCAETGFRERNCSVCGHTEYEVIDSVPHTYGEWQVIKEANCAEEGEETAVCEKCGDVISRTTEKPAHTEGEWQIVKEATETEEGAKQLTCSVCGKVLDTKTIPKIETNIMIGDINSDGSVDAVDAQLIMNYLNANESLSNYQKLTADVNGDRTLDKDDATLLSQHINGETVESHIGELINLSALAGDVNRDGYTNISDATYIQFAIAEFVELTELDSIIYDLNGDGKVNIEDVTELQKYLAKFVNSVSVSQTQILPYSIRLDERNLTLGVGEKKKLNLNILPLDLVNFEITFTSDNESVAVVDSDGLIKAVGIGTANITIQTENGLQESCCVMVNESSEYTFTYNDDDTFTITGYTGSDTSLLIPSTIYNKKVTAIAPNAFKNNTQITEVTVSDGIESIGSYAFDSCSNLKSISIPDSVTVIKNNAFGYCTSLTSVTLPSELTTIADYLFIHSGIVSINIPNKVKRIGAKAFLSCSELTNVVIPDSMKTIDNWSFAYCRKLKSIDLASVQSVKSNAFMGSGIEELHIPTQMMYLENGAFAGCSNLKSVSVAPDNTRYCAEESVMFSKDKSTLLLYPAGKEESYYQIPDGVEIIGYAAFRGSGIVSVKLPNSVTFINDYAFEYCKNLSLFEFTQNIQNIPDGMFSDCENLKYVVGTEQVNRVGSSAFSSCCSLKMINLPNADTIENCAFCDCRSLSSIVLNDNAEIQFGAFSECSSLRHIFKCSNNNGNPEDGWNVDSDNDALFNAVLCTGSSDVYSVIYIAPTCDDDGSLEFRCNLCGYSDLYIISSFSHEYQAISIQSPTCMKEGYTVYRCVHCGDEYRDDFTPVTDHNFVDGKCEYCELADPSFEISGTTGDCVWTLNKSSKTLTISGGTRMEDYQYNQHAPWESYGSDLEHIVIENGITKLGDYAFYNCSGVNEINIPDSVKEIGKYSLYNTGITELVIPDSVTDIANWAIQKCQNLTSVSIGKKVESIGYAAFANCSALTSISIPDSVTQLDDYVFSRCISLKSVTLPDTIKKIPSGFFYECTGLESVSIPESVTCISSYSFKNCDSLTKLEIPQGVNAINECAFRDCDNLKEFVIPETIEDIMDYSIGYYYDNGYKKYTDIVIKGYTNSAAETYANDNGFAFVSIGVRTEQ